MSRWFRLYDDAINDPKILRLPESARWQWVATLCIASKNDGVLPQLSDVALLLRMPLKKASAVLARLRAAELLDETDAGLKPHNWDGRQYKSDNSTERVRKHRASRNVSGNGVEAIQTSLALSAATAPETDTESEPESSSLTRTQDVLDPSIAERDYFIRGKALLGKNAGGLLAKLKAAKGGNVALARAALETASTKENPKEYIGGVLRAEAQGAAQGAKPLTEFQRKQAETNDVRANLKELANGGASCGAADRLLSGDPGERSEGLCGGPGEDVLALPGGAGGGGG
ncbi:hypothetical protein V1291_004818 [Nitrobacteraceae bacterium AZCC 1564]